MNWRRCNSVITRARHRHAACTHVRELPQVLPGLPVRRCRSACRAGRSFDGVELHYAHAYTMASFLSRTNTRDDGYGGACEK